MNTSELLKLLIDLKAVIEEYKTVQIKSTLTHNT